VEWWILTGSTMLYNLFNFQSNDNWDTDGFYWYNEFYTKKPVWTGLNQFHGLQKTGPRWSGSVPAISGSVLDQLWSMVARFGGKKPDWTRLANTMDRLMSSFRHRSLVFPSLFTLAVSLKNGGVLAVVPAIVLTITVLMWSNRDGPQRV